MTVPTITIATLGDLADAGMGLIWYCDGCGRPLALTLARAIEMWGRDQVYVKWTPPIKCASCGSKAISGSVQANTTIAPAPPDPFAHR